jgi:muramoyltetrapeptide carboxypeptidase
MTDFFGALEPLGEGSRVALVAPAGLLKDYSQVERAVRNTEMLGWMPAPGSNVSATYAYFAGTDEVRIHDFNAALRDDSIDGVWCVRGGYGAMRLLDDIDYDALRRHPKPVIGFSDITAIHAAIHRECGIVSFHGPTARGELTPYSRDHLVRAVIDHRDSCGAAASGKVLRKGKAQGRLAGGNLALVTSLIGTPWSVDFEGAILVLEDIDEAVYRVDRMMRQLLLSGALHVCAGIVAGDFRPPAGETTVDNRTVDDVIAEAADAAGVPCFSGAPFGHIDDQWTIPLGANAVMDTDDCSLHVTGMEPAQL